MAVNTVWYLSSVGWSAVPAWTAATAVTVGARRRATAPAVNSERVFVCTVAGTTGGTEPTWVITKGAATTDNTVTWREITGQPPVNGDIANTPLSSQVRSINPGNSQIIRNNTSTHLFCMTAPIGSCGAGEPTYNTTTGATTTDGANTWTCLGPVGTFTAWQAPFARITQCVATNFGVVGDTIYTASTHAETQASALTASAGGAAGVFFSFICVAVAGSIPPTAADITTGASVSTTGANNLTVNGSVFFHGFTFNAGSGAVTAGLLMGATTGNYMRFDNCQMNILATTGINFTFGTSKSRIELNNVTMTFSGSTANALQFMGHVLWRDTPNALALAPGGAAWPTNLIVTTQGAGNILIENVDLSAAASTRLVDVNSQFSSRFIFSRCKLPNIAVSNMAGNTPAGAVVDIINCDTAGGAYKHSRDDPTGRHFADPTVLRTGGASDGTTPYSWRYAIGTTARWANPFDSMPIAVWNGTTGADVTVAIEGIWNAAAVPNNDDVWLEAAYLGTAASTYGRRKSNTKASVLAAGSALPASTEAWDATARANSTAYALGDAIKLASNPGRVFFATTAGTSAGSEPAGYAAAVDGGSVTDGTAVFRAGCRFRLAATLTSPQPQAAGYVNCAVRVGRASTTSLYIDPEPVLA